MTRTAFVVLVLTACHRKPQTTAVTIPVSSAASSQATADVSAPPPPASAPAPAAVAVTEGSPTHFKNGARGVVAGVTFTVHLLPKLMVSGPQPEIEQAQIDVERGSQRGVVQIDTLHKRAEWGGVEFELGYADVYHDDIELTIRRK